MGIGLGLGNVFGDEIGNWWGGGERVERFWVGWRKKREKGNGVGRILSWMGRGITYTTYRNKIELQ